MFTHLCRRVAVAKWPLVCLEIQRQVTLEAWAADDTY